MARHSPAPTVARGRSLGGWRNGRCDEHGGSAGVATPRPTSSPSAGTSSRGVGAADARRARLRPHQPARDRAELGVLARGAALLLHRQARPDHRVRAAVQGDLRDALRRRGRHRDDRAEDCRSAFGEALVATMRDDAPMHRLWYDLRSQALFERGVPRRRAGDRHLARADDLAGAEPLRRPRRRARAPCRRRSAYAALDGLFQQALLRHLGGDGGAGEHLLTGSAALIDQLVPTA